VLVTVKPVTTDDDLPMLRFEGVNSAEAHTPEPVGAAGVADAT